MKAHYTDKPEPIKIIYNDDCAVIDFLSDLTDRGPIKALERFVRFSKREPVCLLYNCEIDNIIVLILYKAPLDFNEAPNVLILFAHSELVFLYTYFDSWIRQTAESNNMLYGALNDILGTIQHELDRIKDKNTQVNFLG